MKPSIIINKLRQFIIFSIWLFIWQLGHFLVGNELLIPSPLSTLIRLAEMLQTIDFYRQVAATFYRVFVGVMVSLVVGGISALLSYKIRFIDELFKPMVTFMKTTPVMAIIILALLWFKSGQVPIFVCFLMVYPIIYTNVLTGLRQLDQSLIELNKVFEVKPVLQIKECYWPQLIPYLKAALQLAIGIGWKVVIAAEVLAVPYYAMGYELLDAKIYLETSEVFAWVIAIIILSQCCEAMVNRMLNRKEATYDYHKGSI